MRIITFQFFISFLVLITLIIGYGESAGDELRNKRKRIQGQTSHGGETSHGHFAASETPSMSFRNEILANGI
jgi:hypothetical protein